MPAPRGSQKAPRKLPEAPRGSQNLQKGSQKAPRRLPESSQKLPEAEFNSRPQGLAKAESCWDFTCRPKGSQIEEICRPKGLQMAEICLPKAPRGSQKALKRLPARIWPKTAVSQGSQKGSLIAGRRASKWQKFASKRLLARIWAPRRLPEAPRRLPEGSQRLPEAP